MVVTRAGTWSRGPPLEWAHRLGASPPKRMADSWSGSDAGPTEYKVAARCYAPKWRAPLGSYSHCQYEDPVHVRRGRQREISLTPAGWHPHSGPAVQRVPVALCDPRPLW